MIVIYVSLKQKKVAEIKIEQDKLLPKHYIWVFVHHRLFRLRSWWKVGSRTTLSLCSGSSGSSMPTTCQGRNTTPLQPEAMSRWEALRMPLVQRSPAHQVEPQDLQWRLLPTVTLPPSNHVCLLHFFSFVYYHCSSACFVEWWPSLGDCIMLVVHHLSCISQKHCLLGFTLGTL